MDQSTGANFTGIGARALRKEDERLLHGRGRFVDDLSFPRLLEAAFWRSPVAHGRLLDVPRPPEHVGRVFAWADMAGVKPITARSTLPGYQVSDYPPMADGRADHAATEARWEIYRRGVDFIQKYIFPGGMLPTAAHLRAEAARAGLAVEGSIEFGDSYSQTLRRWHDSFAHRWDEVRRLGFDERFRRMWEFYLASCAGAFRGGSCDVTQITLTRPQG